MTINWLPNGAVPVFHRFAQHVGRRGAYLVVFGTVFALLGFSTPDPANPMYVIAQTLLPLSAWPLLFTAAGVTAIVSGLLLKPPKAIGFFALQFVSGTWGAVILAVVFVPGPSGSAGRLGMLWVLVAVATHIVAGMIEPNSVGKS